LRGHEALGEQRDLAAARGLDRKIDDQHGVAGRAAMDEHVAMAASERRGTGCSSRSSEERAGVVEHDVEPAAQAVVERP